jgi:hypothetical protein
MDFDETNRLNRVEQFEELARLFPYGPAGEDILKELAPDGWDQSELLAVAHPSVQVRFEEATQMHKNISSFLRSMGKVGSDPDDPPTMEKMRAEHKDVPVHANGECAEIVGKCLWDIFSDNHDVIAPDGRVMDIGSFRGAGHTIAEWLNETLGCSDYDYIDFYMGTVWISSRADLSPVYRMIFERLKRLGFDWRYSFPRMGLVSFGSGQTPGDEVAYDPSKSFEREQKEKEREEQIQEMRENLRDAYNESVQEAKTMPPPETVKAYMRVFGKAPVGWPPVMDDGQRDDLTM